MADTASHPNAWAAFVRNLTERPGWSPTRLASATGINRRTIYRYMDGSQTNVKQATIDAIAEGGDVDKRLVAEAAASLERQLEADEEEAIRLIRSSSLSEEDQRNLVRLVHQMRDADEATRADNIRFMLRQQKALG